MQSGGCEQFLQQYIWRDKIVARGQQIIEIGQTWLKMIQKEKTEDFYPIWVLVIFSY